MTQKRKKACSWVGAAVVALTVSATQAGTMEHELAPTKVQTVASAGQGSWPLRQNCPSDAIKCGFWSTTS